MESLIRISFLTCYLLHFTLETKYEHSECFRSDDGKSLHGYNMKDLQGRAIDFKTYSGAITLVVNVASFWVLTNVTYTQLNALTDKYGNMKIKTRTGSYTQDCSLKVLGFPCNQVRKFHCVKYTKIWVFCGPYLQFCHFTEKEGSGKTRILGNFT